MMGKTCAPIRYSLVGVHDHSRSPRERVAYDVARESRHLFGTALSQGRFEPVMVVVSDIPFALETKRVPCYCMTFTRGIKALCFRSKGFVDRILSCQF